MIPGNRAVRTPALGGAGIEPGEGDGAAHLIHDDQVVLGQHPDPLPEGASGLLVALGRPQGLFFRVHPTRCSVRHMVAGLTRT